MDQMYLLRQSAVHVLHNKTRVKVCNVERDKEAFLGTETANGYHTVKRK
jgi:hypothetical protein